MDRWWPAGHIIGWEHAMVHEYYEFLTAIDTGESYKPDFEGGFTVQQAVAAIQESDKRGEWVSL